ncbi:hypothetical protein HYV86_05940 [Candidatus Woesearchaeota archaeon]|nr:hypothetical protein [Candidatus Woesearchaeota archaeon]
MRLHKNAFVMDFLLTIVLAILIFGTAIYGVSKVFRLSDQAEHNFGEVVNTIRQLAQPNMRDDVKTIILIMDQETSIVTFKANQLTVINSEQKRDNEIVEGPGGTSRVEISEPYDFVEAYEYPSQCNEKDCICLCQERKFEISHQEQENGIVKTQQTYSCAKLSCEFMEGIDIVPFHYYREEHDQRRLLLEIVKDSHKIHLQVK